MKRRRWILAAALLAIACVAGGWALLSSSDPGPAAPTPVVTVSVPTAGGSSSDARPADASPRPSTGPLPRAATPPPPSPKPGEPRPRGVQPLVSVRRGARVAIRTGPGGRVVDTLGWRTRCGSPTVLAVFARRGAWAGVPTPLLANGRLGWVKLDRAQFRPGWTRYSIDVDLSAKVARLRLSGRVVRSFSVTVGAPASPTPTGRFAITDKLNGAEYSPVYGCCILALSGHQPHPPPGWNPNRDWRLAIHGGAPGAVSAGCVHADETTLRYLMRMTPLGTPVTVEA